MFQERHQIVRRSKKLLKITSIPLPQTPTHQVYFTGIHATDKVNAEEYITIGREQMAEFKYGWPTNFNKIRHDQECGIDDFKQEDHQAGRKASI